jgi:hypothetical protein
MNWGELSYALEKYKQHVHEIEIQMELHQFAFSGVGNEIRLRDEQGKLIQKANHIKNKERKYNKIFLGKTKENYASAFVDYKKGTRKAIKGVRTVIGMVTRPVKTSKQIAKSKTTSLTRAKIIKPTRRYIKKDIAPDLPKAITQKLVPATHDLIEFVEMVTKFQKISRNPTYIKN